ncbi:hypothetical protein ODJ79_04415 [Actinoplanes sp. KI2]|uniref:hypothetical protein n=1 Tax=Actinoplanes sp. KI2 TaxID=2983315 RepID=UPI0021D60C31|nr:hypothetical protein [Actinoplanes sp. KI2]MCU7722950.1 hypothetical protein [Actinoplanes sp. KI2]
MVHGGYWASAGVLQGRAASASAVALTGAAGVRASDTKWDKPGIVRLFRGADLSGPARADLRAARTGGVRRELAAASSS